MTILSDRRAVSSTLDRAVKALRLELAALGYNPRITDEITTHAYRERTLAGLVEIGCIDPEDLDVLTEAFANGFDEVPADSKLWDRLPGSWITADHVLPADLKPIGFNSPAEARLEKRPAPTESRAYARQVGTFDVHCRPTLEDWKEYQRYQEWRDHSYVVPDVLEAEAAETGRPFSRG